MLIQCTKKLIEQLNIEPELQIKEESLFSCHANLITVNRRKAVVLMNDKNNYIIVLYGLKIKDFKNFDEHILNAIRMVFKEECIRNEIIDMFINDSHEIVYSKTSSRSMISKLNNVCSLVPHFEDLLEGESIYKSALGVKLSRFPFKNSAKKYILPNEELYKDLETLTDENIFTCAGPIYKVIDYAISLTHLYGLVHKDKVIEIYNMQNEDMIDEEIINFHMKKYWGDFNDNYVKIHGDYFVHESILEFDVFEEQLNLRIGKPFYIPKQEELLKYLDKNYNEVTKEYNALLNYVAKNIFGGNKDESILLCDEVRGICQFAFSVQEVFQVFNHRHVNFKSEKQVDEVTQLIMELSNNTRIWENNGHTPQEIFEKFEKPNLRPLPDKPFEFVGSNMFDIKMKQKFGRNDLCPCGSGKKYKKCCLGKDK